MEPASVEVYLMVNDVERSVHFYEDALGVPVDDRGERSARIETAAGTVTLEEDFDAETLADFGLEPPGDARGDGVIVVLEVEDADEACDRARDAGADVMTGPRDVPWGRRLFLVRDPDGYVLEVYHRRPDSSDE